MRFVHYSCLTYRRRLSSSDGPTLRPELVQRFEPRVFLHLAHESVGIDGEGEDLGTVPPRSRTYDEF